MWLRFPEIESGRHCMTPLFKDIQIYKAFVLRNSWASRKCLQVNQQIKPDQTQRQYPPQHYTWLTKNLAWANDRCDSHHWSTSLRSLHAARTTSFGSEGKRWFCALCSSEAQMRRHNCHNSDHFRCRIHQKGSFSWLWLWELDISYHFISCGVPLQTRVTLSELALLNGKLHLDALTAAEE